jgi:hypothetical protein
MSNDNSDKALEYIYELLERQGAAASTVKDGHMLFFKREFLQRLLDAHPGKEKFTIFLQRPDFKN